MHPQWTAGASCANTDPETFFPPSGGLNIIVTNAAKRVCADCPVQTACLTYALDDPNLFGIWGGTTESDREKLRRNAA